MNTCPQCNNSFEGEYLTNEYGRKYLVSKFCSAFCKEEWETERRAIRKDQYVSTKLSFPKWACQKCRHTINLDFEPLREPEKFSQLTCPKCNPTKIAQ